MEDKKDYRKDRIGYKVINVQGLEMTCVEYNNAMDITVQFDNPFYKVKNIWWNFIRGKIKNYNIPTIHKKGIVGDRTIIRENGHDLKEFGCWKDLIFRVYGNKKTDSTSLRYKECKVCEDWIRYPNFFKWVRSQENYDKWLNGERWCLDKDILIKGNKLYSPETCCLVPVNVNTLFVKRDVVRGGLPIGVIRNHKRFSALYSDQFTKKYAYGGTYDTPEEAFYLGYKPNKENMIKRVAQSEYDKGNITKKCYNAMMNYIVEITD